MSRRAAAVGLAAIGLAVSVYLAAYQTHLLAAVWDPVFGSASSERVLRSALSRALPVPDALLGGLAYAGEVAIGLWVLRGAARLVLLAYAALAGGMALVSVGLVAMQLLVVHHLCLLCLVSAVVSWAVAALVLPEGLAALGHHRHEQAGGLAGQQRRPEAVRRP